MGKNKNSKIEIEGVYRSASKSFGFVKLPSGEEVYIATKDSLDAMNNDKVLIKITNNAVSDNKNREGKVTKILERDTDIVVGYFEPNKGFAFVNPINKKIPFDIHIEKKYWGKAVKDSIVEVKLLSKKHKTDNPEGAVIKVLGHKDDPNVELTAIVHDFKIRDVFDEETLKEADEVAKPILEIDLQGRKDLRDKYFITIDGEDTKDIDDAICLETLGNGQKKLYVSIADVSHYVKEGSRLDREALKRGNSVYLLDRVIPMLPHVLSNGMCSLNEAEDRLSMTCEMTFDDKGSIIAHDIYESVINSHKRMTYNQVETIINTVDACEEYDKNIVKMLREMIVLSRLIRKKRSNRGAVNFNLKETVISVDESLKPIGIVEKKELESYKLIEDFMVSANETVAEEYFFREVPFLYRVHEPSEEDKIEALCTTLESISVPIKFNRKSKITPLDMQKLLKSVEGEPYQFVVEKLALRSMSQARYSKNELGHFALAAKYYTHFTSPIRRYSDLQIHRIMHEVMDGTFSDRRFNHYDSILESVAFNISKTERVAIDCERDIEALKKCEFMKDYLGEEFEGTISGLTNFGIFVELDNTIEGMAALRDIKGDKFNFDETKYRVVGEHTKKTYNIGDRVKVQLIKCTPEIRAIDFIFVD